MHTDRQGAESVWPSASSQEARLGSAPRLSPTLRGPRFYHAASQIAWEERRVRLLEMASKPLSAASANLITSSVARVLSRGGSHTRDTDRNTAAESSAVSASVPSKKPKSGLRAALGTLLLQASGRLHGRLRRRAQSAAWLLHYVAAPHSAQNYCAVLGRASSRVF